MADMKTPPSVNLTLLSILLVEDTSFVRLNVTREVLVHMLCSFHVSQHE